MGHDGRAVANFVLDYCEHIDRQLSNLALQKVIYFCHVWSLIDFGRPLIKHHFEAWEFGPVLPYVYHCFKHHQSAHVTSRATSVDDKSGKVMPVPYSFGPDLEVMLKRTIDFYTRMDALELSRMSHAVGGPWHSVWAHSGVVNPGMRIDNDSVKAYYSKARPALGIQ